jgi:hypothetical protein
MEFLDWVGMGRFKLGWGDSGNVSCIYYADRCSTLNEHFPIKPRQLTPWWARLGPVWVSK